MQKKQNIFIAALIIMGIAVGLDLIFGTILVTPIVRAMVFSGSYELIMIVSMLVLFLMY